MWLVVSDLVPSGTVAVTAWPTSSPYVSDPVPPARVAAVTGGDGTVGYQILAEPVYIDLQQPRPFQTVAVELQLEPGTSELVELGLAVNGQDAGATLVPAFHRSLERLSFDPAWQVRRERELTLLQRKPEYPDLGAFFRTPPEAAEVATYRVPFTLAFPAQPLPVTGPATETDFILTGYQPGAGWEGWRTVRAEFTLSPEQAAARELRLVISVPERPLPSAPVRFARLNIVLSGEAINRRVISGWISRWLQR